MEYVSVFLLVLVTLSAPTAVESKSWRLLASDGCRAEDGFFKCKTLKQCIKRERVRQSISDCTDGSDEKIEPLACSDDEVRCRVTKRCVLRQDMNTILGCVLHDTITLPCRFNEYECVKSKKCIPRWMVLDGNEDCGTMLIPDKSDETIGLSNCLRSEFTCGLTTNHRARCIPRDWVMDGHRDCKDGSDEGRTLVSCHNDTEFRCESNGRCLPRYRVLDGYNDCPNASDEKQALKCIPGKEFQCLDNGRCIPRSWRGNTMVNCKDGSDEVPLTKNDTCTEGEFRCNNSKRCIPDPLLCDGMDHCGDCSDEIESCREPRMFRCPSQPEKCIHRSRSCDTFTDCINNTDDINSLTGFKCARNHVTAKRYCVIPQWMLRDNYANCDDDSDLCFIVNGTSTCSTCLDGKTVIASRQLCDGVLDCPNFSDECLCLGGRASKAISEFCSNVCYAYNEACNRCKRKQVWCPMDNKCINSSQVCDGKSDCPLSNLDEKLCTLPTAVQETAKILDFKCEPLHPLLKSFVPLSRIDSFAGHFAPDKAKSCDGITECLNMEDECSPQAGCEHRPSVCDRIPLRNHDFPSEFFGRSGSFKVKARRCKGVINFAFGKSICNGVKECDDGADELDCGDRRFECDAGTTNWPTGMKRVVNIALTKRCDGNMPTDCVDQSDEKNCNESTHFYCENGDPLFVNASQVLDGKQDCSDFSDECPKNVTFEGGISSREDLIKSQFLQVLIWFMMHFAIIGNISVAGLTLAKIFKRRNPTKRRSKVAVVNDLLILNLSAADFLMGIVLLTIAYKSVEFKGKYCLVDKPWRTSVTCAAVGVMTVLSSQASVLTLVVITSYRLFGVLRPIDSQYIRLRVLGAWIAAVWTVSLIIALIPLAPALANSMVNKAWISASAFVPTDIIHLSDLQQYTPRVAGLSNAANAVNLPGNWYNIENYLKSNFPNVSLDVKGYFGYYSESGVCIPRLYRISVMHNDLNWMTSLVITFNFVALLYIIAAYVTIYRRSTANKVSGTSSQDHRKAQAMYRKITFLITSDMICWFPICVMTFLSMAKVILPPEAYAVSAIVLLPINSSLNPIIYTNPFPLLWRAINKGYQRIRKTWQSTSSPGPPS